MTTEEARALLGLTGPCDAKTVKRAYLREVRTTPPERDPEGFQRLRHAFELLQGEAGGPTIGKPPPVSPSSPPPSAKKTAPHFDVPDAEPSRSEAEPGEELAGRAWSHFAEGDLFAAADALESLIELARTELRPALLADSLAIRVGLALASLGEGDRGLGLIWQWEVESGNPPLADLDAATTALASELVAVAHDIEPAFVAPMAEAILTGDFDGAGKRLKGLARADPEAGRRTLHYIRRIRPLRQPFGRHLDWREALAQWVTRHVGLLILVFALIRLLYHWWFSWR